MGKYIPADEFGRLFDLVPRLAIDLMIVQDNRILLAKRNIEPQKGSWHFPGSFLKKDEYIDECIGRILKEELGLSGAEFKKQLDHVDDSPQQDPRGHVVALRYTIKLNRYDFLPTGQNSKVQFFSKLPKEMGFDHREILSRLGFN